MGDSLSLPRRVKNWSSYPRHKHESILMKAFLKKCVVLTLATLLLSACSFLGNKITNDLAWTSWELVSYQGISPITDTTLSLSFEEEYVGGVAGCNSFGGEYQIKGDQISISAEFMSERFCLSEEVMAQENTFIRMLGDAQSFELNPGQLVIVTSQGEILVFEATFLKM